MHFFNGRRLRVYPRIVVVLAALWWCAWILAGEGLADPGGQAIGGDFVTFYAASELALDGRAEDAYDPALLYEAEQQVIESDRSERPWSYPPALYLLVMPLATAPYLVAFVVWTGLMGTAYVLTARAVAPLPNIGWLAAASAGFLVCLVNGQTGILMGVVLATGLLVLPRNPYAGGAILGLMILKPQLGLLVPIAILAGRHWRAIAPGVGVAGVASVASLLVLGDETWRAFRDAAGDQLGYLEDGRWSFEKMATVEASALLLGLPVWTARGLQLASAVGAAGAVAWIWAGDAPHRVKCAGLAFGALLATPYAYDYDMALTGVGLAFLAMEAHENGWLRWEREALLLGYLVPFLFVPAATLTGIGPAPAVMVLLLAVAVRRTREHAEPSGRERDEAGPAIRIATT